MSKKTFFLSDDFCSFMRLKSKWDTFLRREDYVLCESSRITNEKISFGFCPEVEEYILVE